VFRRLDDLLPLPPLSLIAILERRSTQSQQTGTCVPSPERAALQA
jgi:hypothetical protein